MKARIRQIALVALVLPSLAACAALEETNAFDNVMESFGKVPKENSEAELGIAEMAKGNNVAAQAHFNRALKANPNDVHALLGAGIMYQNTGQPTKARQMYEALLALRPSADQQLMIWADRQTQPIAEIASVNLGLLHTGEIVNQNMVPAMVANQNPSGGAMYAEQSELHVQPMSPYLSKPQAAASTMHANAPAMRADTPANTNAPLFADADENIVKRFKTVRALFDQGLMTQEEFVARRQANVGALLPLTSPPPAVGLDRPVPDVTQIVGRLRAISRALEMRAITVRQQAEERAMILDALMPAQIKNMALPPAPPQGLMEAADAVRRIEMMREHDLVTSDEYARERQAIERLMQTNTMAATGDAMSQAMAGTTEMSGGQKAGGGKSLSGFQPAVHLASYKTKKAAERGWAQLSKAHRALLGNLQEDISRVDLGRKGVFWRLKAGPLEDNGAAQALCRKLKAARQFCEPSTINFG